MQPILDTDNTSLPSLRRFSLNLPDILATRVTHEYVQLAGTGGNDSGVIELTLADSGYDPGSVTMDQWISLVLVQAWDSDLMDEVGSGDWTTPHFAMVWNGALSYITQYAVVDEVTVWQGLLKPPGEGPMVGSDDVVTLYLTYSGLGTDQASRLFYVGIAIYSDSEPPVVVTGDAWRTGALSWGSAPPEVPGGGGGDA